MDINFHDPSDIPLPPEDVRIRELRVEPLQDRRRVRLLIEITPFQQKPNLEIKIMTATGHEAASLSIIEAIDYKMQFTVHLKDESASGEYIAESSPLTSARQHSRSPVLRMLPSPSSPIIITQNITQ